MMGSRRWMRTGEELFDMVSYLDPDVFGSYKQIEHKIDGYGQTHMDKENHILGTSILA
ncbi:hypothetical protein LIER_28915 [Lithospermum erythrorhizon]|uniref:Uncharacterized protein n=1 Tax=Lithospermum erythrorhizon TaxID=34254 RepID=A0AAV3RL17_LITER